VQYRMLTLSSKMAVDTLEAHVLARAYRAMWHVRYGTDPAGQHVIATLDLVIDFGAAAARAWPFDRLPWTSRTH